MRRKMFLSCRGSGISELRWPSGNSTFLCLGDLSIDVYSLLPCCGDLIDGCITPASLQVEADILVVHGFAASDFI